MPDDPRVARSKASILEATALVSPVDRAVSVVVGPLFYRAMISFEPIDDDFVEGVVDGAVEALRADA